MKDLNNLLGSPSRCSVGDRVVVNTPNGYGSVATSTRRFTTVLDRVGLSISYSPNAVNGDQFVINVDGVYAMTYTDTMNAAENIGITRNSDGITTINSLPASQVLNSVRASGADLAFSVSITRPLAHGDIIRCQTQAGASGDTSAFKPMFSITRIA